MAIKAIIFDCFGVLYIHVGEDFYRSHIASYEARRAELQELGRQADFGHISQDEFIHSVAAMAGMSADDVRDQIVRGLIRNTALLDFAQSLRPRYKVSVLSNVSKGTMDSFFPPNERSKLFDDFIISSDEGMIKPDPAIFKLACSRLGVAPQEAVMIDDSPINCSGATEVGIHAIIYHTTNQVKHELITVLQEVS